MTYPVSRKTSFSYARIALVLGLLAVGGGVVCLGFWHPQVTSSTIEKVIPDERLAH